MATSTSTYVACALCFLLLSQDVHSWSGNYYTVQNQPNYATRSECCSWFLWWCVGHRTIWYIASWTPIYSCCSGWTHNGDQNCNIPVCSPTCKNGGTCIAASSSNCYSYTGYCSCNSNTCSCPFGYTGTDCAGTVCSHLAPCYPGDCINTNGCQCAGGFRTSSSQLKEHCLSIDYTNINVDLKIYTMQVRMSYWPRGVNPPVEKYRLLTDSTRLEENQMDFLWTNQRDFNRLETTCSSQFFTKDLPPKPYYIGKTVMGVVSAQADVHLSKRPVYPATDRFYSLNGTIPCPIAVSALKPEPWVYECNITNPNFDRLLEHGDFLKVTYRTSGGGFRELIDLNTGRAVENQTFTGSSKYLSVEFRFDFQPPYHCAEKNCSNGKDILDVPDITKTSPLPIFWTGWTDDDSKMFRYAMEVFKMTKTADGGLEIKPSEALNPLHIREVFHFNLTSQLYTPPEPGMYSIILEAADLANNTKYVRRLCLYDPTSVITNDPDHGFYVSTASKAANYTYQSNTSAGIVVTWDKHFRNAFHEDNNLLGPVRLFPPSLENHKKNIPVNTPLEDHDGKVTVSGIANARGIVKFHISYATDHDGGRQQPIQPPTPWQDVGFNTTMIVPLTPSEGDTVTVWVKATDAMGNEKVERTTVTFDTTKPVVKSPVFLMNNPAPGIDFSSTFELTANDDNSGIAYVLWTFTRRNGSVIYQERVPGNRAAKEECTDFTKCKCTPTLDCFWFDQSYSLSNCHMMVEKENLNTEVLTVTADITNMAGIVTTTTMQKGNLTLLNGTEAYFPPRNLKVLSITNIGVTLSWDFPPSCFRRVELWIIVNDRKEPVHKDATQFDLAGLDSGTAYTIYMQTVYEGGEMSDRQPLTFTTVTTTAPTTAQCPAGHFINAVDNGRCTQCAVGRYQERANQNDCKKCPAGSTTNTTGARDIQACRAPPQMKSTASVHLRYVLLVICTREDEVKTSSAVHARVVVMQSDWTGLCNDSACSNSHVTSTCEGPTSKIITSVIAFDDISPTLSSTNTSTTLPTNEALLQAILLRDSFDLQGITGAVLSKSDVSVTVTYSCRAGYVPSSDTCVAVSGGGISPELIGSIVGGCIGLIAVILLVILVIRQFRKPRTQRQTDRPTTEHPYDSLTSSAVGIPYTDLNSPPVPHSWHLLDTCAPNRPISERKSESFPQQETVSDYDYLELQEATKHVYLTPAGMPATLQEMTSSPDQELTPKPELPSRTGVTPLSDNHLKLEDATMDTYLTRFGMPPTLQDMTSKSDHEMMSKPELPSRTGVTPLSDLQGRGDLGSNDTAVEMASAAPRDTTPTAHTLAAESDYITPIF